MLKIQILGKQLFIFYFFFAACSKNAPIPYPQDIEREKIEGFLSQFLLEEGGIYTLFGDKPITDICFFIGTSEDISLEGLSDEAMKRVVYIDNESNLENWNVWKKYTQSIAYKQFCFIEVPCPADPLHVLYVMLNLKEVKKIICQYEKEFWSRIGVNLQNFEEEVKNPKSFFWKKILTDHYLMGLLHGYGEKNSIYFGKLLENLGSPIPFTELRGPFSPDNFPLPVYASSQQGDSKKRSYEKQREKIKKIYKNKDFVEVTLKRLTQ